MLFNSFEFIFIFLPLAVSVYFILGRYWGGGAAKVSIALASLAFYSWWDIRNLPILLGSLLFNYFVAQFMILSRHKGRSETFIWYVLAGGVISNIMLIAWFKYTNFAIDIFNFISGDQISFIDIVLPLGISFFTFQKIAFLIDVHGRQLDDIKFADYALFVTFFPQLLAGPIVHHREMMPQFAEAETYSPKLELIAQGLMLFSIGLAKKTLVADNIAPIASPVFGAAASGVPLTVVEAWVGAVAYTLQIYFDFSGYSDMAIGLSLLFGVRLPLNFNSPLKSASIIEFWQRWHMTLTRFLTAYIYNPMVVRVTRRRMAKGKPVLRRGTGTPTAFLTLVAIPTVATMTLAGLWHGAGLQYVLFGFLHGLMIAINHGWRMLQHRLSFKPSGKAHPWLAVGLTFLFIVVTLVLFRAPDVPSGWAMIKAMFGANAFGLPASWGTKIGSLLPVMNALGIVFDGDQGLVYGRSVLICAILVVLVLTLPNSIQITGFQPPHAAEVPPAPRPLRWHLYLRWAVLCGVVLAGATVAIDKTSEFLYFQF